MKNFCYFLLFLLLLSHNSFCQKELLKEAAIKIALADSTNQLFTGIFQVAVSDTTDISQIEIKLGSESGSSDLCNNVFDFDVLSPATGYSYSRSKYNINLGVPAFSLHSTYYGQVCVKDKTGTWTNAMLFVAN